MEKGAGRSSDDRSAAREARERARAARERGLPEGEAPAGSEQRRRERGEGGWQPPDLGKMSRYGGSIDPFLKRRLVAGAAVVAVLLLLFLLAGGC